MPIHRLVIFLLTKNFQYLNRYFLLLIVEKDIFEEVVEALVERTDSRLIFFNKTLENKKLKPSGLCKSEDVDKDGKRNYGVYIDGFRMVTENVDLSVALSLYYHAHEKFDIKYDLETENLMTFIAQVVFGSFHTSPDVLSLQNFIYECTFALGTSGSQQAEGEAEGEDESVESPVDSELDQDGSESEQP